MKPTAHNAFERSWSAARGPRSLVSMLTPMQAKIVEVGDRFELTLAPMRAVDALGVWSNLADAEPAATLLADRKDSAQAVSSANEIGGLKLLERLAIETGEHVDAHHLLLADDQLDEVVDMISSDRLQLVKLTGMVDARDAAAIDAAIANNTSALDADVRAIASMEVVRDNIITMHVRNPVHAYQLVAENFRQYLAAMLGKPARSLDAPQPWQIERLMSVTGELTVRPIETEIFSTFVDIGISTNPAGMTGPAARSLIYDLPSGTWHDEE